MKPRMCSDLAIDALLMAVWRRKPKQEVMIHWVLKTARKEALTRGVGLVFTTVVLHLIDR